MTRLAAPVGDASRRALLRRGLVLPLAASVATGLSACGFQLRQTPEFAFKSIYTAVAPTSVLGIELRRQFAAMGHVELITDPARQKSAQVMLEVLEELREKTVVGINAAGQVREFQLRIRVRFRLRNAQGADLIPETELLQQREISFSESAVLSKEAEEAQLYRSMQTDTVQQIMRRLAAVKDIAPVN